MAFAVSDVETRPVLEESLWSARYRGLTIGLALIVSFAAFEALAVSTILPKVVRELGGLALYGWTFSAFMLTNLVGSVVAGHEADRVGIARPFGIGIALFTLGLLLGGTAPTMVALVFSRAVQGFGAGMISSLAYVSIGRGYPAGAQSRMMAVLSAAWIVPGLTGPAVAALVATHFGWRWVFLGLAPLPFLAALMALPALRPLRPTAGIASRTDRRLLDAVLMAVGAALFLAGLSAKTPLVALLMLPGLALALPALRRLLPPGTLRARRGLPAAILSVGLLNAAFFGADAFIPLGLTAVRGQSLTLAGLALTGGSITWTLGAWLQHHLAGHLDRRRLTITGLLLIALGILGVAGVFASSLPAWLVLVWWGISALGMGIAFSTTKLAALQSAPAGQEGATSASMQIADVLGNALGTGVGGALVAYASAHTGSPRSGILLLDLLMTALLGLTVLTALRLPSAGPDNH